MIKISVPYRGATFLNDDLGYTNDYVFLFPSPIGELHFSMLKKKMHKNTPILFPSPIGELHFSILYDNFHETIETRFPSPIGELHFSIPSPQPHVLSGTNRGIAGEK